MVYIFVGILVLWLIMCILNSIGSFFASIFTLSFLPNAIGMFDGKMDTVASSIPILSNLIEGLINWISVVFINFVDFILWFIYWIPGVKQIIELIYRAPDLVERLIPHMLGAHRNFITHSVLNPVFLVFIMIAFVLCKILNKFEMGTIISGLLMIIGLGFACHLLADTMPKSWVGFANIKVQIFATMFVMPPWLGKLWLLVNAIFCIKLTCKVTLDTEE